MRLLYYFPAESASLIANRLDHLNVSRTGPPSAKPANESEFAAWVKREVANEVRTDSFISATAWSSRPEIIEAMMRIAERTDDEDIIDIVKKTR